MRIYCIPGIGLDERLFERLEIEGAELVHVKWVKAELPLDMKTYAISLSKQIKTDKPFCLLGVSFGGMLCAELSEILQPQRTFLISSAKCRSELPAHLRMLKYAPAHLMFGEKFYRWTSKRTWRFIGVRPEDKRTFFSMIDSPPQPYYQAAAHCVLYWDRVIPPKNIIHIHGDADNVLPFKNVKDVIRIPGGDHAMIAYRVDEIAEILKTALN